MDTVPDHICHDRTLVTKIGEFLCVAQTIQKALKLNIHLYEQLCRFKDKHRLYILSNIDLETWDYLRQRHADVLALFDGVVISGQSKLLKPEKDIFNLLFTQFDLKPACCRLIDDQEENCLTADQLGMKTTFYTKNLVISD